MSGWLVLLLLLAAPPAAFAQDPPPPVITGVSPSCIEPGGTMTITGTNLNADQAARNRYRLVGVLDRRKVHTLPKISWSEQQIKASLPADVFAPGQSYAVGIRNVVDQWASNTDQKFTVCTPGAKSGGLKAVPAKKGPSKLKSIPGMPDTPGVQNSGEGSFDDSAVGEFGADEDFGEFGLPPDGPSGPLEVLKGSGGGGASSNMGSLEAPPTDENDDIEAGELLAVHEALEQAQPFDEKVAEQGGRLVRRRVLTGVGVVMSTYRFGDNAQLRQARAALARDFEGLALDFNNRYEALGEAQAAAQSALRKLLQWHDGLIECGRGLRIGMLDTGIYTNHAALLGRNIQQKNFLPAGAKGAGQDHGTAVATLLVGNPGVPGHAGLLPEAELYAGNVFRQAGSRLSSTAEWLVLGLDWLVTQQVSVINLSLGGAENRIVEIALNKVLGAGIKVVAAAGTDNKRDRPLYPAYMPGVIAVAGVDAEMKPGRKNPQGGYLAFVAPGIDVWAGNDEGGGSYYSGSSYAAPFVTAALAASGAEGYETLARSARDLGDKGRDPVFGWGLVQFMSECGR